jgi:hypothetical protein
MLKIYHNIVLGQAHSLFRSEFFTECDLVLFSLNFSYIFVYYGHPVAAYIFFLVSHSVLFLQYCILVNRVHILLFVTNSIQQDPFWGQRSCSVDKKFSAFMKTEVVCFLTTVRHWTLSSERWIQIRPEHLTFCTKFYFCIAIYTVTFSE